jgi:hypothetical protein
VSDFFLFFKEAQFMNKALGAVFGFIGAILLLLPVAAFAGPQLPGEPTGSHTFCAGSQNGPRSVTISSALGRVQPIRAHGTSGRPCKETISIADTRVNITILGDGGDTLTNGSACADPNNTILVGEDPSAAQIIQVRGRNITITGLEIMGQSILDVPVSFLNNNLGLFQGPDYQTDSTANDSNGTGAGCPGGGLANAKNLNCNNNRGIRAQRGGILLIGRTSYFGGFLPVLTAGNHNPAQAEEKTGVCIHHVAKNGIEITAGSSARIINSEVHDSTGDGINLSEMSTATIGFDSGGNFNLTNDPFRNPGNGGPNWLHNNTGNGVAIQRNSLGRVVGNTINFNGTSGINVTRGGSADVADNFLNANSQFGVAVNDNSQVNMGTTGNSVLCDLVAKANVKPPSIGGGTGAVMPSAAGSQCPGGGLASGLQNTGTTGAGQFNVSNLANTVTASNGSGGISCVRSYIAGRSTANRAALAVATGLSGNGGAGTNVFTTCTSNLN